MTLRSGSSCRSSPDLPGSDMPWEQLYCILRPRVAHWVHSSSLSSWSRQRDEIITDIVQETMIRLLNYARRAERGEVAPIDSLEHLSLIVAYNCFRDLWRRDHCLIYIIQQDYAAQRASSLSSSLDQFEAVLDHVFEEWLFSFLAREIVNFPEKQRTALLMDLANRMHFGPQPTVLQRAFLEVGIDLQQYQRELPADPAERGRHASLLSLAYKRLARIVQGQLRAQAA
ncbi:sigma-70 family RNA polymerase sigma factor [Thermogemmatispora onikobensis]|uniref:sigma-70 family RNA polymerase sigma factor n=1 Tax=Thermogemmatispora onikobensis TaxID=732234 RepID=UPI000852EE18|nr:sigma-70 family RNA polymerase sigma factor [Thermogemmatispora onikobensis]